MNTTAPIMIAIRTVETADLFTPFVGGQAYRTPGGSHGVRLPSTTLVYRTPLRVPVEVMRLDFHRFDEAMRAPIYDDVAWCNNWVSEVQPKLHLFQPCDEPGVDDAVAARVSTLSLEGPIPISQCEVGEIVMVRIPMRQCGMVQCHAVVVGAHETALVPEAHPS